MNIGTGGSKGISIGIRIGTDITPLLDELKKLKQSLSELGSQHGRRGTIGDLKTATNEWRLALAAVNKELDTTIGKLGTVKKNNPFLTASPTGAAPAMTAVPTGAPAPLQIKSGPFAAAFGQRRHFSLSPKIISPEQQTLMRAGKRALAGVSKDSPLPIDSDTSYQGALGLINNLRPVDSIEILRRERKLAAIQRQVDKHQAAGDKKRLQSANTAWQRAAAQLNDIRTWNSSVSQLQEQARDLHTTRSMTGARLEAAAYREEEARLGKRFKAVMRESRPFEKFFEKNITLRRFNIAQRKEADIHGERVTQEWLEKYDRSLLSKKARASARAAVEWKEREYTPVINALKEAQIGVTSARRNKTLTPDVLNKLSANVDNVRAIQRSLAVVRDGGSVPSMNISAKRAGELHTQLAGMLDRADVVRQGKSISSNPLAQSLGFATATQGIQQTIQAMKQLFSLAKDVDSAFARVHASISRIGDITERKDAFKTISTGMTSDALRTGMSFSELGDIHTSVYLGTKGTGGERAALSRTIANMHFTGSLDKGESIGTLASMNNAGMNAADIRGYFEQMNAVGGMMHLDPQRMRAMLSATSANLPSLGGSVSMDDIKAWALQEAAGSRDMVMGSKLNRIQIGLQNGRTIQRLTEILSRGGTRSSIGGQDIGNIVNSGNPMLTMGRLQTLIKAGEVNGAETAQIGQAIDQWNSPGTIQILKGGLDPYKKMLRQSEALTKSGLVSTDEAAAEQASSMEAHINRVQNSFKELTQAMAPASSGFKNAATGITTFVTTISKHSDAVKWITGSLLALASVAAIGKGSQLAGAGITGLYSLASGGAKGGAGALAALGGPWGLAAGAVVTAGVAGYSLYKSHRDAESSKITEQTKIGATESVTQFTGAWSDVNQLRSMAAEYQKLVDDGKGSTKEALGLRKDILTILGKESAKEVEKLKTMTQQTSEMRKQIDLKDRQLGNSAKQRASEGGSLYAMSMFYKGTAWGGDSLGVEMSKAGRAYQADGSEADKKFGEEVEYRVNKAWSDNPGTSDVAKNARNKQFVEVWSKLRGYTAAKYGMDPSEIGRNKKTLNAAMQSAQHMGRTFNPDKPDLEGVYLDTLDRAQEARVVNARADHNTPEMIEHLLNYGVFNARFGKGMDATTAARELQAWWVDQTPEQRAAVRKHLEARAEGERKVAVGKLVASRAFFGSTRAVRTDGAVDEAAIDSLVSNRDMALNNVEGVRPGAQGGTEALKYQFIRDVLKSIPSDEKGERGVPTDIDMIKSPFQAFRRFTSEVATYMGAGAYHKGIKSLTDPKNQLAQWKHLMEKSYGDSIKDAQAKGNGAAVEGLRQQQQEEMAQIVAWWSPENIKKIKKGGIKGLLTEGNADWGIGEEAEAVESVRGNMRALPADEMGSKLWELDFAVAKARGEVSRADSNISALTVHGDLLPNETEREFVARYGGAYEYRKREEGRVKERAAIKARHAFAFERDYARDSFTLQASRSSAAGAINNGTEDERREASLRLLQQEYELEGKYAGVKAQTAGFEMEAIGHLEKQLALSQQLFDLDEARVRNKKALAEGESWGKGALDDAITGNALGRNERIGASMRQLALKGVADRGWTAITKVGEYFGGADVSNPLTALGAMLYDPTGDKSHATALETNTKAIASLTDAITTLHSRAFSGTEQPGTVMPVGVTGNGVVLPASMMPAAFSRMGMSGPRLVASPVSGAPVWSVMNPGSSAVGAGLPGSLSSTWDVPTFSPSFGSFKSTYTGGNFNTQADNALNGGISAAGYNSATHKAVPVAGASGWSAFSQGFMHGVDGGALKGWGTKGLTKAGDTWVNAKGETVKVGSGVDGETGDLNAEGTGAAAAAAVGVGLAMYSGYKAQKGNGQAAQNYGALSGGLMSGASIAAGAGQWYAAAALAVASLASSALSSASAAKHSAEEQTKAYERQQSDMQRMIAIAEDQRKSLGIAAERTLSTHADVGNVFQGIAASAFLSGRYAQNAPTVHVQQLVVQANNPSELSAALAQGVNAEIRRGA